MLTKKHFERLADILAYMEAVNLTDLGLVYFDSLGSFLIGAIAEMCGEDNPRFDYQKFFLRIEELRDQYVAEMSGEDQTE